MLELLGEDDTLLKASVRELQRQLMPNDRRTRQDIDPQHTINKVRLAEFVETTSGLIMEPWQVHLCERLQKLTYQKGQRILLHKPPQHGGSVIVSQRLPAYLLADNPYKRVRLACYNIEHATKFTAINKTIMQSSEYRSLFPDRDLVIPVRSSDAQFSTIGRSRMRDAQASLMALGLATGFVGSGADDLIIDDPYASPQAAASPAIRASTWTFWTGSAKVRIDEDTNVIVMFHRYNEEDYAGQLIAEEGLIQQGGKWELISYRAEWDGDTRPEVGGEDPIGRKFGEYLSPRKAKQIGYYPEQKRNPKIWQSQFQGKPSGVDGSFFLVKKFRVIPKCTVRIIKTCFAWDLASSVDGDYTVGVLMGLGIDGRVYVLKVIRFRENTDERNKEIKSACLSAVRHYPETIFRLPQDPAGAGKDVVLMMRKLLIGLNVKFETIRGDKELRADPWSQYVNAGLVDLVYQGDITEKDEESEFVSWVPNYISEHRKFPNSNKDDQIDASADAFGEVALEIESIPGEDFDTVGISGERDDLSQVIAESEQDMLYDIMLYEVGEMDNAYSKFIVEGRINNESKSFQETSNLKLSTPSQRRSKIKVKTRRVKYQ